MKSLPVTVLLLALSHIAGASENAAEATSSAAPENTAMCSSCSTAETVLHTPTSPPVSQPPSYAAKLRSDAEAVLKGPDFHQLESGTQPVPRPWLKKWLSREKKEEETTTAPNFSGMAKILKILVVVTLILLLLWLLWRGYQWLAPQLGSEQKLRRHGHIREAESQALPENAALPERISDTAARAWQAGDASAALSLLYRGAVAALASRHALSLPSGATEGDYQRLLRRSGRHELASGFNAIAEAWIAQAYANRRPADFSRLLQVYRQHFEAVGSTA